MKAAPRSRRDRIRAQLADLKMPGALEALDEVLTRVDGGGVTASEAIEQLMGAQISLRNNRRLEAAMRSSSRPTRASRSGARSWATRSWPRHSSTGCCTTVTSLTSADGVPLTVEGGGSGESPC